MGWLNQFCWNFSLISKLFFLKLKVGAIKAGVTIVTFEEKDNIDSLNQTLKDSGAKGLLFSPDTAIHQSKEGHVTTRKTFL